MTFKKFLLLLISITFCIALRAQCDYEAGNTCESAPVICDISCLNGFTDTLKTASDVAVYLSQQPSAICWDSMNLLFGYNPQNIAWFAFVAGSNHAKITVTPSNCKKGDGIQLGLFNNCIFDDTDPTKSNFDPLQYLGCDQSNNATDPVTIETYKLQTARVYYFFVDGINADVCKFTVKVDTAKQFINLQEIPGFFEGNDSLILCPNTPFTLTPESYNLPIDYYWKVDPPCPEYPTGKFEKLTRSTTWMFNTLGRYNISLYGYNSCDGTDTISRTIIVKNLVDEDFGTVDICQNLFPYLGPTEVDPNGDGTKGWLGLPITNTGVNTYKVDVGTCFYNQKINVNQIPLQPRKNVTLVDCQPFQYHGLDITGNLLDYPYSLQGLRDKNGCDSLVSVDAYILDLTGDIVSQNCANGIITLGYNPTFVNAPVGYTINYIWKDQNNNIITDNNSDPTNIEINTKTTVNLTLNLVVNGKTCSFNELPLVADPSKQLPSDPLPIAWDTEFCESNPIVSFEVQQLPGILKYNWTANNDAIFIGNTNTNKVQIDFSKSPEESNVKVCVSQENACGKSNQICYDIWKSASPEDPTITSEDTVCFGDNIILNANNKNNIDPSKTIYKWTLNGGSVVQGDVQKDKFITYKYNAAGQYTASMQVSHRECIGPNANKLITVLPIVSKPNLTSTSFADHVMVEWNSVPCATEYRCYINGVLKLTTTDKKLLVDKLDPNTLLNIKVEVVGANCACGISSENIVVSTLSCKEAKLILKSPQTIVCENDWDKQIKLEFTISGNLANNTPKWSGNITTDGIVTPSLLKEGLHTFYLNYEEYGCVYKDSINLTFVKTPDADINILDPECKDEATGHVMVLPKIPNLKLTYKIDGRPMIEGEMEEISIGTHQIEILDANNCSVIKSFSINPPIYPRIGFNNDPAPYFDNESIKLHLIDTTSNSIIDSVVWLINNEIYCSGDCHEILLENIKEGNYNHQVIVFYKKCNLSEIFDLTIHPAPKIYASNIMIVENGEASHFKLTSNDENLIIKSLQIYSYWGEKVFSKTNFIISENDGKVWDGTFNDKYVASGVYVYSLEYINEKGELVKVVKDITVLR